MIPAMPASRRRRAARSRRPSAALRAGRVASMGLVALLILIAGVWASWGTAQHVMLPGGREKGTVVVTRCGEESCTGPFTPGSAGATARKTMTIAEPIAVEVGQTYSVVVKPDSDEAVRSGPAGILYAWVPLGGALLLASVIVAGGLRKARLAWLMAGSGVALVTAAFLAV
ncbi:hypothetical protein DF268_35675 [Streptomyces sp. V2]|uniref:Integral membrane protein n=1 Tax=Streptomyces niveiscabiei TaxID=164115 RepID=A0ABW9HI63_9ACTN|nr:MULTISPECIES: hypothetical protein [Streptomyces]PWG08806.1 hypothetical protein DF268_35675 [Streptomyces sp. V2]